MSLSTYNTSFSGPSQISDRVLIIEQERWSDYHNNITKENFLRQLGSLITSYTGEESLLFSPVFNCLTSKGATESEHNLSTILHVYPFDPTLVYNLEATKNTFLTSRKNTVIRQIEKEQIFSFNNTQSIQFEYPCQKLITIEWLGTPYDSKLNKVPIPLYEHDTQKISIKGDVRISAKVKYLTTRHDYSVIVKPTNDLVGFSSIVFAYFAGGVVWQDIKPPSGGLSISDEEKGWHCIWEVKPQEYGIPRHPKIPTNRYTEEDYCSGEIISDRIS